MREAIASLFLYLLKIYHMKLINYLFIALIIISSCKEEEDTPTLEKNYGSGIYIASDNGVNFYKDGVLSNNIFKKVNGISLKNVNKIKFQGTKVYIATEKSLFSANIETFEIKAEVTGFMNLFDFDFVPIGRIFAVAKDDSKVKVVELDRMEIISDVEVGVSSKPVFILTKWYRSYVMNGGAVADSLKDSTIVAIDYIDEVVPFANMMGSLNIGDNPNSAVWINDLKILCKGIYDSNNPINNTESILTRVQPWSMEVVWTQNLNNIFNAQNLISNDSDNKYFFTAADGVYQMNNDGTAISRKINFTSDFIAIKAESYSLTDSTFAYANMLYVNDAISNPNTVFKYNTVTSEFCDTIFVDSPVRDIAFYQ